MEDNYTHTQKLDYIISALKTGEGCSAPSSIVQEHTRLLAGMNENLKNIDRSLVSLAEKFDSHVDDIYSKVNGQDKEITTMKAEKKTMFAVLSSIGSVFLALLALAFQFIRKV